MTNLRSYHSHKGSRQNSISLAWGDASYDKSAHSHTGSPWRMRRGHRSTPLHARARGRAPTWLSTPLPTQTNPSPLSDATTSEKSRFIATDCCAHFITCHIYFEIQHCHNLGMETPPVPKVTMMP